jgi:hypothetical protein
MIKNSINNKEGLQVQEIVPNEDRSFHMNIGHTKETVLPIHIELPPLAEVSNHPVSEFIDNFASGKIENLVGETVYIGV